MKQTVRSQWQRTLLVCRKCAKHGGFGAAGDERLGKALRRQIGGGKGRKARVGIVEVPCLGICPKAATVVVDAANPGEWLLVKAGTDIGEVAERLGFAAD